MPGKRITIDLANMPSDEIEQSEIMLSLKAPLNAIREAVAAHKAVKLTIAFSDLRGPKPDAVATVSGAMRSAAAE